MHWCEHGRMYRFPFTALIMWVFFSRQPVSTGTKSDTKLKRWICECESGHSSRTGEQLMWGEARPSLSISRQAWWTLTPPALWSLVSSLFYKQIHVETFLNWHFDCMSSILTVFGLFGGNNRHEINRYERAQWDWFPFPFWRLISSLWFHALSPSGCVWTYTIMFPLLLHEALIIPTKNMTDNRRRRRSGSKQTSFPGASVFWTER